jgi:predicted P-loop ATPase
MSDAPPTLADLQHQLNGWRAGLLFSQRNVPKPLLANALTALREAPEWRGVVAYDAFALVTMLLKPPPWLRDEDKWTPKQWTDRDDALTADWLQHQGIGVTVNVAATAAETVAKDHSFHPIKDYLESLIWDGVERITHFAARYLGAEDTPYRRTVSRCLFIASVARIMRPGCKADYVPILEGAQDKGKSTAIELLFTPWFSDDLAELGTKDAAMQVRVAWGIEIAELASMTRGEIERVKAFITRKVDRFRPSYGRRVIEVPRQSVFIGSTNSEAYLKDETGGRQFWPIRCGNIDLKAIERDRSQLWAEAVTQFNAGTPWWITDTEIVGLVRDEQAARYVDDPWQEPVAKYLCSQTDVGVGDVLSNLLIERGRWTQSDQNRVARCLKVLGWERHRGPRPLREWRYRRVAPVESGTDATDRDQQPIDI